jgi:hypothetical protein
VFLALVIQHTKCMNHVVICGLSGSTGFFYMFHLWHDLKKKLLTINACFSFLYKSAWNIRMQRDIITNLQRFSWKVPIIIADFNENWIFRPIFEKYSNIKFNEKLQWEPRRSMRTDGRTERQTDMTKLIVALRDFANAPENWFRQAHWFLLHHAVQIGCV